MADANLFLALKNTDKLTDIQVIGKVRCLIEKPDIISTLNLKEGHFAIVDVYALKCMGQDYFGNITGYYDKDKIYLSNGSLIFCLTDKSMVGKVVKIGSKFNLSGTIKRQTYVRDQRKGFHCFAFRRNSDGSWCIGPNTVKALTPKDVVGTILADYLKVDSDGNELEEFKFPESTMNIMEYCGVSEYKEIAVSDEDTSPKLDNWNRLAPTQKKSDLSVTEDGRVDVSKIDLHLVKHLEAQEKSELYDVIREEVDSLIGRMSVTSKNLVADLEKVSNLLDHYYEDEFDEDSSPIDVVFDIANTLRYTYISCFAENYGIPISGRVKVKGKDFVDKLINALYDAKFSDTEERSSDEKSKIYAEGVDKLKKSVAFNPFVLGEEYKEIVPILGDDIKMASLVIGNVSGIGELNMVKNYNSCNRYYKMSVKSWFMSLIFRPYALALLGNSLNVVDCDKLYLTFGKVFSEKYLDEEILESEYSTNMKIRDKLLMMEGISKEESSTSNTLVSLYRMKSKYFKFYPDRARKLWEENGYPMDMNSLEAVRQLLRIDLAPLDSDIYIGENPCNDTIVSEMEEMGIIDTVNEKYLAMSKNMYKEFFIYKVLIEKGHATTGITDDQVDEVIGEFEEKKGFKLESLQKDGIKLVKYMAAVLSGCAGSGKTTTSDCMSMVLKKYIGEDYTIVYGTPTGKACRRLAEVVGGNVRTLHSLFGVGVDSEPYLVPPRQKLNFTSKNIYILDEMAMCSTDLLFEVVKNLSNQDLIYFLGDIKQLPPIGRGIPFSMLMSILPCVELGVSKRAASGSLVNYNCLLINFLSSGSGMVDLKFDNDTFVSENCDDSLIPVKTCKMFKDLMAGKYGGKSYAEDDIQVITEYQDPKKSWAAPVLNPPIQEFLRRNDEVLFQNTTRTFYRNDRVIHVSRNSYEMKRYERLSGSTYRELVTFGAVNGEVGKLVGVLRSDLVTFIPFDPDEYEKNAKTESEKVLLERWEERQDDLRDDSSFSDESFYFVVVQYYDTDLHRDVFVMYRSHLRGVNSNFAMDSTRYLEGVDLGNLDLAYALTAHKMQGSQAKAIIAVFGKSGSPMFVNRNMINVIITRSEEFVGLVGSITGEMSAISKGRANVSPKKRDDILGVLAGEVEV